MTILIPYRLEVHNGIELKYALRSIQKYLSGWTNVIIIGHPPDWYKGDYILSGDAQGRKEYNIYSKILLACGYDRVTEDFIMWNDDHYLLKPLSEIKYWHNGTLDPDKSGGGRQRIAIQNTIAILNQNNVLNYDIHTPIVYNKARFKRIFGEIRAEVVIKSLYCNTVGMIGEFMEDCKISQWVDRGKLVELTKGRLFFSTGTSLSTPTLDYLNELFPEPSKFEL